MTTPPDGLPETEYPPRGQGYYCVVVMTRAMVFAFIDRQIPTMLVEPIKADLGLTDTHIALLGGATRAEDRYMIGIVA